MEDTFSRNVRDIEFRSNRDQTFQWASLRQNSRKLELYYYAEAKVNAWDTINGDYRLVPSTMLEYLLKELQAACSPIAISVSSEDVEFQSANDIFQVRDRFDNSGPIEGIRASLESLESHCSYAFVTACDVPYVNVKVIELLKERIGSAEAIIPVQGKRRFGMTSLIRTTAHRKIKPLVSNGRLRVSYLADALNCVEFPAHEIRAVDEELLCLTNINTPEQYLEFLRREGLQCDAQTLQRLFNQGTN